MPKEPSNQVVADASQADSRAQELAEARKSLLAGVLWCVGGLAFTVISYYITTAGSRYIVATGAVIWGAIQAFKGLIVILKIQHREGRFTAFWRTIALGVCSLAAVVYLGQLSTKLMNGDEVPLMETEQLYTCEAQNFKVRVPAGFTKFEEMTQVETDEYYASVGLDAYNDQIGFDIKAIVDIIPEGAASVDEIADICYRRDSAFYTEGFVAPTQRTVVGGREMLCSEGYLTESPELVYAVYDMLHGHSIVSATFRYEKKDYGRQDIRERIETLLNGIELGE